MTHAQAATLLAILFLVAGIVNVVWPERLLGRVQKKGLGTSRMRLILAPFPERYHPMVIRVAGALAILAAFLAFNEAWTRG